MRRWDSTDFSPEGKCWRCGKPIVEGDRVYFSGPAGEPAHAECESDAMSRTPTDRGQNFEVLFKRAKNIAAESVLKIGSLDIAKKAADDWLRTRGRRGEGGAKVVDLYDQRTVYEVVLNADSELVEVPILPFADRPRPKRR